jgi:hypothetical protein
MMVQQAQQHENEQADAEPRTEGIADDQRNGGTRSDEDQRSGPDLVHV